MMIVPVLYRIYVRRWGSGQGPRPIYVVVLSDICQLHRNIGLFKVGGQRKGQELESVQTLG